MAFDALARAHPSHRGASKLTEALHTHTPGTTITKSDLEERFLQLCRAHGLPRPRVNHFIEGKERDFVFAKQRLVIETDSWRHHRTRDAFENDRARDAALAAAGFRTLRFTHRQLTADQHAVAATLHAVLDAQPGYADPMSEQSSGGAGETAREMREHEREARERDADERDPDTGTADPRADEPAPPANVQTGEVSGGS